jgi:hypothetical protein
MISSLKSTFSSADTRVLLVAADRAILYLFESGELGQAYIFNADEAGLALFSRALGELAPGPVCLLVDVVEEEYRQDTIPHVGGADRKAVLERKYARLFRGTSYHYALRQGRDPDGRRDDRVLLTALTRPEILTPWIAVLSNHRIPLVGIYSLPILSERLLKKIGAAAANVLLISLQKASGLRQSFFRDRQLKISRLAYMPRLGSVPFAAHLMGEVEKLRRYLNSLALISRDSPLSIYILSQGQLLTELEQHCRDTEQERFFLLDVDDVARRLGCKQTGESHYSDLIFAKLLADKAPLNHYAKSDQTQIYSMHRYRAALTAASIILLLGGAGWSGINFIEGVTFKQQAIDALQKADFYQKRYELARQKLPPTPVEPREIKIAVDAVDTLRQHKSSPEPLLRLLSGALGAVPDIRLDGLSWAAGADPDPDAAKTKGSKRGKPERVAAAPRTYYHIAEVRGHLEPFHGDYRGAIEIIDGFAAKLGARPDVHEVTVMQYPLDVRSEVSVSGSTTPGTERAAAQFKIKLIVGVGNGGQQS